MKKAVFLSIIVFSFLLIAPPDENIFLFDAQTNNDSDLIQKTELEQHHIRKNPTKTFTQKPEINPQKIKGRHSHEHQENGKSLFEDELKTAFDMRKKNPKITRERSLNQAKNLWSKSQDSHIPARDFVIHLKGRYENSLHNIYSGEKNSFARKEFEADLQEIDPFLYKTWRDSFFVKHGKQNNNIRTDQHFFKWLNEHPDNLISSQSEHEKTPLEVACDGNSSEMAQKILDIAQNHEININILIAPLIEKYKIIYQEHGENSAYDYLQSIYNLHIQKLSHAMFEKLKTIPFPSST